MWSVDGGFVDFFLRFPHFPINAPHWIALGIERPKARRRRSRARVLTNVSARKFQSGLQMALIEKMGKLVMISTAQLYKNVQPLKLGSSIFVTRGYGSADEHRLQANFAIPASYFRRGCMTWTVRREARRGARRDESMDGTLMAFAVLHAAHATRRALRCRAGASRSLQRDDAMRCVW